MVKNINLSCRRRGCLAILFSVISNAVRNLCHDNKEGSLRFPTFLQNDTFTSYGTVSEAGIQIFQTAASTPDTGACPRRDPAFTGGKFFFLNAVKFNSPMREKNTIVHQQPSKKKQGHFWPCLLDVYGAYGVIS